MTTNKQFNYNQHKKTSNNFNDIQDQKLAEIPHNKVSRLYTATYQNFRRTYSAFVFRFFFVIVLLFGTMSVFGALLYQKKHDKPPILPPANQIQWYNNFFEKFSVSVKAEINSINTEFQFANDQLPTRSAFGYYKSDWFPQSENFDNNPNLAMRPAPNDAGSFDFNSVNVGLFSVDQMDSFGIPGMSNNEQSSLGTQTTPYLSTIASVVLTDGIGNQNDWRKNVRIEPIYKNDVTKSAYVYAKVSAATYNGTNGIVNYLRFIYNGIFPQKLAVTLPPTVSVSDFKQADYQMTGQDSAIQNERNYKFNNFINKLVQGGWTQQISPASIGYHPTAFSGLSFANFGDPFTDTDHHHNYWFFYSANHLTKDEYTAANSFFNFKIQNNPPDSGDTDLSVSNNDYQNFGFFEKQWSGTNNTKLINNRYNFIENSPKVDFKVYQAYQNYFRDYGVVKNKQNEISLNVITNSAENTYFHDDNNSIYGNSINSIAQNIFYGFTGKINSADLGSVFTNAFSQVPEDKISYQISYGSPDGSYQKAQLDNSNADHLYNVKKIRKDIIFENAYDVIRKGIGNKFWTIANLNRFIANQPNDPNQHKDIINTNNIDFKPSPQQENQDLYGYENNADLNTDFVNLMNLDQNNQKTDKRFKFNHTILQKMLETTNYYLDVISSCKGNDPNHSGRTYSSVIYRIPLTIFLLPAYNYEEGTGNSPFYNDRYAFGIGFDRDVLTAGNQSNVNHPIINNSGQSFAYQGQPLPDAQSFKRILSTDQNHQNLKLSFGNLDLDSVYVNISLGLFV